MRLKQYRGREAGLPEKAKECAERHQSLLLIISVSFHAPQQSGFERSVSIKA
jgi:hypothetical protein